MDTTAHLVSMALYNLAEYPHIQDKLRQEVDSLFESPEQIEHKDLNNLVYMG